MDNSINRFDSADFKRSRRAYTAQCAFEYFISILSGDVFLAKLLKSIGLSDALTGILSSLITFTFLFQLFSIPLAGKVKNVKRPIIALDTLSQLLFASLYIVPFMPFNRQSKAVALVVLILSAYLALYLNTTLCYKWGNSFVSPDKRGSFTATKEMISLLSGVFFTLGMGYMVDRFELSGNLNGAFRFIAVSMTVICAFNLLCLCFMKERPLTESTVKQSIPEIFRNTLANKNCRNAMILTALNELARFFAIGFMATYKTVELGFTVGQTQVINVAACMGRFVVSKPLGRYSDRRSYSNGYFLGNLMTLAAFALGVFITPSTRWLIVPFTMLYQMSFAGTNQNTYNMMYSFAPEEYILSATAVNNSIRGIFGFIASFFGGIVLDSVQNSGNKALGRGMYAQQLLCAVSAVMTAVTLVFNKVVVSRQKEDKK